MAAPMLRSCLTRSYKYCVNLSKDLNMLKIHTSACSNLADVDERRDIHEIISKLNAESILSFFNNCDSITLSKLVSRNRALFHDLDPMTVVTREKKPTRFSSLQSLQEYLRLEEMDVALVQDYIAELRHKEFTRFGMNKVSPFFKMQHKLNLQKVVSVEVYQQMVAWTEESMDRTVVSMGQCQLEYKQIGSHVDFQRQIIDIVKKIPESTVYLMQLSQDIINEQRFHQATIQALIVTLLNCRLDNKFKLTFGQQLNNKVFMLYHTNLEDCYGLIYHKDIYSWDKAQKWLDNEPGPFTGMKMSGDLTEILKERMEEQSLLIKCMLLADMFIRTLNKRSNQFPSGYTAHGGI